MKIVVLDGYCLNPGDLSWDFLSRFGEYTVYDRTPNELIVSRIGDAEIVLLNKTPISEETLAACPSVKLICVLATGFNVVDVAAARKRNIPVCNVPDYGTAAVAQFTFALLLDLCHKVAHHAQTVRDGKWCTCPDFCYWDTPQMELAGKTIGIIGFGRIGRAVGKIARAFGMNVIAYNRSQCEEGHAIGDYVNIDTLLSTADIISLHCPLTEETYHIINEQSLAACKRGVVLINTSRGALVDAEALLAAIKARQVGAACLDVYEEESDLFFEDNSGHILEDDTLARLISMPNVIVSSHQAFLTEEALSNIAETTVSNLIQIACGACENEVLI